MKKILLSTLLVTTSLVAFSQFTAGKLAVYRYGSGAAALNTAVTTAVFIDEYNLDGTVAQTIDIPTTTNGANFRLVGLPTGNGTSFSTEGMSSLSSDGSYLSIFGYNQAPGSGTYSTVSRVIARIAADGTINSSTAITFASGITPRAVIATADGLGFYSCGNGAGVQYSTVGQTTGHTLINSSPGSVRSYTIFNSTLYAATSLATLRTLNPLTTTANTTLGNLVMPVGTLNNIILFDATADGTPDIIYGVDDVDATNGLLRKYQLVAGSWVAKGSVRVAGKTEGLKSITGKVVGNDIEIYAVTWGTFDVTSPSRLLKFTDAGAVSSTIDATNNDPIILATAPTNTTFRSVTFTPGTTPSTTINTVLPVKLTSFGAKAQNNGAVLSWTTVSEINNSHFDILRSENGSTFTKIGTVRGNGSSNIIHTYTFTDIYPFNGTSYYQLRQVDFDGNSEKSAIISLKMDLAVNDFSVVATDLGQLKISVNSANSGSGQLVITDITGKIILNESPLVEKGYNTLNYSVSLQPGLYIASFKVGNQLSRVKFLK